MPLLSSPVPNLVNGVSQQAPTLRLASELEAQENAYSSVVEGLGKRSPSKHIAKLGSADVSDGFIHQINRSTSERYKVILTNGDLKVFDITTGEEKTVVFPDGKIYLETIGASSTPKSAMRALTVADYTFVLNTEQSVSMDDSTSPSNLGKALVSIKQGQYSTYYAIKIDGLTVAAYVTSNSSIADIRTTNIAFALSTRLLVPSTIPALTTATFHFSISAHPFVLTEVGAFAAYTWSDGDVIELTGGTGVVPGFYSVVARLNNDQIEIDRYVGETIGSLFTGDITSATPPDISGDYTVTRSGSILYITKNDGTAINIAVEDSYGDNAIKVASDTVTHFSDLPVVAPTGFITKVSGDSATDTDDYYVTFVPLNGGSDFGNGNWVETLAPNTPNAFDLSTMPHVLIRNSDGTFTFEEGPWIGRTVGDISSSRDPSFVGETIQDIFFFRSRLGVLSNENVVCSVANGFFKFFRETVSTNLDTDPIDLASTQSQVSLLKHALPFHEELLLFADNAQLVMTSPSLLTQATAVINQTTDYQADLTAKPTGAGDNVYFSFNRGPFSGVREYFIQDTNANTKGASDVTGHVPKYISGAIFKFAACTSEDVLVGFSEGLPNGFYVYKSYWSNDQKLQSSWSKFTFESDCEVLSGDFINSTLYLVVQRADGYHLESMDFQAGQTDTDSAFVTLLDRRLDESQVSISYNAVTDITSWTLPYQITDTMRVTVRAGGETLTEGTSVNLLSQSGTLIRARGNYTDTKVFIGQVYRFISEMSPPVLREPSPNGGQTAVIDGHYSIRTFTVQFDQTTSFEVWVALPGRETKTKVFNSLTLGVGSPGTVFLAAGKLRALVGSEASRVSISLVSDSHLPCHFSSASWEGHFTQRSQRA